MTYVDWGYCSEEDKFYIQEVITPVIFARIAEARPEDMWVLGKV